MNFARWRRRITELLILDLPKLQELQTQLESVYYEKDKAKKSDIIRYLRTSFGITEVLDMKESVQLMFEIVKTSRLSLAVQSLDPKIGEILFYWDGKYHAYFSAKVLGFTPSHYIRILVDNPGRRTKILVTAPELLCRKEGEARSYRRY